MNKGISLYPYLTWIDFEITHLMYWIKIKIQLKDWDKYYSYQINDVKNY